LDSFPAYFPLAGRKVVIAGSGEAADNKARLFDGSPATLVRVDGHAAFLPGTYAGAVLAFVAGDDEVFLQAAASAARAARVLVNVVDKPAMSDFNTPAVIDRGEVVAAVGTGGSSPTLATKLRNDIEAQVPEGAGRVAALLRKFQDEVRAPCPPCTSAGPSCATPWRARPPRRPWPATWRRPASCSARPWPRASAARARCGSSPARVLPTC
jgi:precorrin-2 dehydrogenase/sirohydrochlorin ferrochelatase